MAQDKASTKADTDRRRDQTDSGTAGKSNDDQSNRSGGQAKGKTDTSKSSGASGSGGKGSTDKSGDSRSSGQQRAKGR